MNQTETEGQTEGRTQAVGDGPNVSGAFRLTAIEAPADDVVPRGCDSVDLARGIDQLHRGGDPAHQPAAADRHYYRIQRLGLAHQLEPQGRGRQRDQRSVERMDHGAPLL